MRSILGVLAAVVLANSAIGQHQNAKLWADSVFATLTPDERITQLMVIRSSAPGTNGGGVLYNDKIDLLVKQYNIGGICAFQGTPQEHATMFTRIQAMAKTPVMVTVDGEWGLGMRFSGVQNLPYQLTLGALPDATLVYKTGQAIAVQCRRMNIHVNYAPVVDINNNPANPVIGVRSFGEDKYKVALFGTRIMEGMQDNGVMACAKHFPGHGDVSVDSHLDLPIITKSRAQLDSLELYPFRSLFSKGVGSVMVAHLYIPAIDSTTNQATSLSYKNITGVMRNELGYEGLTFTDALEMKGVSKFYPGGEAAVQSLIAGNDMLCLPADVAQTLAAINVAIANGRLTRQQVDNKCKRVLQEKYNWVYGKTSAIDPDLLTENLNAEVPELRKAVAEQALTVLLQDDGWTPLKTATKTAPLYYVQVGGKPGNAISNLLKTNLKATVYYLPINANPDAADSVRRLMEKNKGQVIVGLHGVGRNPAGNFGLSKAAADFIDDAGNVTGRSLLVFGNPYVIKNFEGSRYNNLVACYEDDSIFQKAGYDFLTGKIEASGSLPVTVGRFMYGSGVKKKLIASTKPVATGFKSAAILAIDSIASEAIEKKAIPGCVVAVLYKGKLVFEKAYGYTTYDSSRPVSINTIYDLASVTKISATTVCVMKLYEQGKLDLKAPISKYLPLLNGTDKANLLVENLLLHQAGLNAFIPFYKEVMDSSGKAKPAIFQHKKSNEFGITVTNEMYMRNDWVDTMYSRIATSKLTVNELKYVYSDNDFILLGKIVEAASGLTLDEFARQNFYAPMGMHTTGFKPNNTFELTKIAPTENEKTFRQQQLWSTTHDPGAAMFGNVAGHAGLFSNAPDLMKLYQMLLEGGKYQGKQYLKKSTIDSFTAYNSPISRRGLGFDKTEKDNALRSIEKAYPSASASGQTYGHTGYTGTCVWVDPAKQLVYIFLSNRVYPDGGDNLKLSTLNIRSRIQEAIYAGIKELP